MVFFISLVVALATELFVLLILISRLCMPATKLEGNLIFNPLLVIVC